MHQLNLSALLMTDGVRHQLEARVVCFLNRLIGHGDRAFVVDRHQTHEQVIERIRLHPENE